MMSRMSIGWLFAALFFLPGLQPEAPAADLKIAVVSMERLFDEYYKTKEANGKFKARADEMDIKRRELLADVKTLKNELEVLGAEARDKSLNDAERNKKQAQAEDKYTQARNAEEQLMEFDKTCKQKFGDQMRQIQQQIVLEIRAVIQSYIKDRGITLVLDSSGKTMNNVEAVLIADKSFDITDAILAIINKDRPQAALNSVASSNSTSSGSVTPSKK